MLYVMVVAAVVFIPAKLGGYGHIFASAGAALKTHTPPGSLILPPSQYLSYSTLAFGSAIAVVLYPHTITGVLSSASGKVIRRNAALLPAYNLLLALICIAGVHGAGCGHPYCQHIERGAAVVCEDVSGLVRGIFAWPPLAIGALVPAAIMSIASANLFTRNLLGEALRRKMTNAEEARNAKLVSIFIKLGALAFVLFVKSQYAIELQLLGGIWIGQLFPSVICGVFTRWFHGRALFWGWAAGMATGTGMGDCPRFEKLDLSDSHRRTHLCDVRSDSGAGGEPAAFCVADGGFSCGRVGSGR